MQQSGALHPTLRASPGAHAEYAVGNEGAILPTTGRPSRKMLLQLVATASCCIAMTGALVSAANHNIEMRELVHRLVGAAENATRTGILAAPAAAPMPAVALARLGGAGSAGRTVASEQSQEVVASAAIPPPPAARPDPEPKAKASSKPPEASAANREPPTSKYTAAARDVGSTQPALQQPEPGMRRLSPNDVTTLLAQGDAALRTGDITAARLFYQFAANGGNGAAAVRLGATFEFIGDFPQAVFWYRQARQFGNKDAEALLKRKEFPPK